MNTTEQQPESWEKRKKYPHREIEFKDGTIVREYILSETEIDQLFISKEELREILDRVGGKYKGDGLIGHRGDFYQHFAQDILNLLEK